MNLIHFVRLKVMLINLHSNNNPQLASQGLKTVRPYKCWLL